MNVLQISVTRRDLKTSQSNSIFLCSQCCEELKIKLAKQLHKGGHNGVQDNHTGQTTRIK